MILEIIALFLGVISLYCFVQLIPIFISLLTCMWITVFYMWIYFKSVMHTLYLFAFAPFYIPYDNTAEEFLSLLMGFIFIWYCMFLLACKMLF